VFITDATVGRAESAGMPRAIAAKLLTYRDGHGSELVWFRAGMSRWRPQPRQHPEACACTFGTFYTDMR